MKHFLATIFYSVNKLSKRFHSPLSLSYLLICLLIPLVLTTIWFRSGNTLMGAEEGPIFYQPQHTFQLYRQVWTDSGLGLANPLIIARVPFYAALNFLSQIGLPSVAIQQLTFFLLQIVPLLTIPLLVKQFFPTHNRAGQISAIFYLFNLYGMSQIWYRFLYPQIFLWSYLPLFLWLLHNWIIKRRLHWLIWLLISSFIYSLMFSFISTVMVMWSIAGLVWIYDLITQPQRLRIIYAFLIAAISWLITNLWWLMPILAVQNNNYSSLLNPDTNFIALTEVSRYFPITSILLLKQDYFFTVNPLWNKYLFSDLIPWTILIITIIGLVSQFKQHATKLFLVIGLIGLLISKGTNPPFGQELFQWLFTNLPITQILRNPYEKYGLVWLLVYAIFFGQGLNWLFRKQQFLGLVTLFVICLFSTKPLWSGTIYATFSVNPPVDYQQVNQLLSQHQAHRLLSLPFLNEAGIRYNWGYRGEELSELFLVKPALSRTYHAAGDIYPLLEPFLTSNNFSRLFPILAIDHVIVHHDELNSAGNPIDSASSLQLTRQWGLIPIYQSSNLSLYRTPIPVQWGYLADQVITVSQPSDGFKLIINQQLDPSHQVFSQNLPVNLPTQVESLPQFQIVKLSPDYYQISINQAKQPYYLVLSTSYNPNWQARINQKLITDHFMVNGYANGWFINQEGVYSIDLKFKSWPN